MGLKEIISNLGEKSRERKEKIRALDEDIRMQRLVEDRMKSSNERELERFVKEEREEQIKEQLEFERKKRDEDIKFGHQPLNTPNITSKTEWEVMKERNMFGSKNSKSMFSNQEFIHKTNKNLMKNNNSLLRSKNNMFKTKGGML